MKTKTFLTVIGLITSQSLFYSCSEDTLNAQQDNSTSSTLSVLKTSPTFVSGNYFVNPQPINAAFAFMQQRVSQAGSSYVLTQTDLTIFYDKAQIDPSERLTLDQMNAIIDKIMSMMQMPFEQAIQQVNISDAAKSLAITINNSGSISHIEINQQFANLPATEKAMIKNLNDFKFNVEQGNYAISPIATNKQPAWITGGMIGMAGGGIVGGLAFGPVGALVGAGVGVVGGIIVGAIVGAK
ncbi:hypothetical protein SAMN05421664_3322 [Chryseobacterium soldanellicola]|uniref:Uncharacterized protein n=1 Tax=Chryseobacterium soldanellicola TaxID=311333 RepID=A0A1H1FXE8_9FLAO|nr:hypothetical protein [Chryseobacterium soldanellicola]SDR05654.1 hypothetical protein SAMN05421664_3322 [Chryseobacterium soldanellicola]